MLTDAFAPTKEYRKPNDGARRPDCKRRRTPKVCYTDTPDFTRTNDSPCRYRQLRERLVELDSQRQQRQRRLDQLQQLQRLLEPFAEPQQNIQPNLITRDGELVQELEKMGMLVARVGGRIGQKKRPRGNSEAGNASYPTGSDQKLEALLDMD